MEETHSGSPWEKIKATDERIRVRAQKTSDIGFQLYVVSMKSDAAIYPDFSLRFLHPIAKTRFRQFGIFFLPTSYYSLNFSQAAKRANVWTTNFYIFVHDYTRLAKNPSILFVQVSQHFYKC